MLPSCIRVPRSAVTAGILNRGSRVVACTRASGTAGEGERIAARAAHTAAGSQASLRDAHWFKELYDRHERRRSRWILLFGWRREDSTVMDQTAVSRSTHSMRCRSASMRWLASVTGCGEGAPAAESAASSSAARSSTRSSSARGACCWSAAHCASRRIAARRSASARLGSEATRNCRPTIETTTDSDPPSPTRQALRQRFDALSRDGDTLLPVGQLDTQPGVLRRQLLDAMQSRLDDLLEPVERRRLSSRLGRYRFRAVHGGDYTADGDAGKAAAAEAAVVAPPAAVEDGA